MEEGFPIYLSSSCGESGVSPEMQFIDEDYVESYQEGLRTTFDMTIAAATTKLMHVTARRNLSENLQERVSKVENEMVDHQSAPPIAKVNQVMEREGAPIEPAERLSFIEREMIGKSYAGEITIPRNIRNFWHRE